MLTFEVDSGIVPVFVRVVVQLHQALRRNDVTLKGNSLDWGYPREAGPF